MLKKNSIQSVGRKAHLLDEAGNFAFTEAFKTLRTNLTFTLHEKGCKKIALTSSVPTEGKTTVSVNLAISLAQTQAKVLLIDTDLRKPRVHIYLGGKNVPGLSNILGDFNSLTDVIRKSKYENLHYIASGVIPPNPAELLSSDTMRDLIAALEAHYDYIILDTPPIGLVSDALALSPIVSGFVVVVKQNFTHHEQLEKTLSSLKLINAKVLGVVFNETIKKKSYYVSKGKYNYGYGYGYGYNYGYDHHTGSKGQQSPPAK